MSAPNSVSAPALPPAVAQARRLSRYLARMLDSPPWLAEALAASIERPLAEADLQRFVAAREVRHGGGDGALRLALRQLRMWTLCHLIVRDLALGAPLAEVTETMTLLAINRGDMAATGAGQFPVRFSTASEEYNGTSRIKVGFINNIPRDVNADALLDITLGLATGALAGKKEAGPRKGSSTSAAPDAKAPNTDDVNF